jgi:hypothetical protein
MRNLVLFVIILSILFSCEKDIVKPIIINEISAGVYDSLTMEHHKLNPNWILIENEIGCHKYLGIDSLNIGPDTNYALKFRSYWFSDIFCECSTDTIGDCFGSIYFEKSIEIAKDFEIHTDTLNWITPLNKGEILNSKLNWCKDKKVLFFTVYDVSNLGQGYWKPYLIKEPKYFGIRKIETADTIYGWILIDTRQTIRIMEYAFNKKLEK